MIIGLDVGSARVGVAISDDRGCMALPLGTYEIEGRQAENAILQLVQERGVKLLVAGLPLSESGARTSQCDKIESFCRRLKRRAAVEVRFVDEYLSSQEAQERLESLKRKKNARRGKCVVDAVSACIILQAFLDREPE